MNHTADKAFESIDPRHRIVGAIVLVALGVIFLPMVLDNPISTDVGMGPVIEIPEKTKKIFISKITAVDQPVQVEKSGADVPRIAPEKKTGKPAKPVASTKKQAKSKVSGERSARVGAGKPPVRAASNAVVTGTGWVVRIGSFSKRVNADRIVTTLRKQGFKPKSGRVKVAGAPATRVWVGTFKNKDAAVAARARILRATGQEGLIVAFP